MKSKRNPLGEWLPSRKASRAAARCVWRRNVASVAGWLLEMIEERQGKGREFLKVLTAVPYNRETYYALGMEKMKPLGTMDTNESIMEAALKLLGMRYGIRHYRFSPGADDSVTVYHLGW